MKITQRFTSEGVRYGWRRGIQSSHPEVSEHAVTHDWFIEEREYQRHEERRGRRHAYQEVDPARTALVVVDVIPFFVEQSAYARGIVPRINDLALAVRAASTR